MIGARAKIADTSRGTGAGLDLGATPGQRAKVCLFLQDPPGQGLHNPPGEGRGKREGAAPPEAITGTDLQAAYRLLAMVAEVSWDIRIMDETM